MSGPIIIAAASLAGVVIRATCVLAALVIGIGRGVRQDVTAFRAEAAADRRAMQDAADTFRPEIQRAQDAFRAEMQRSPCGNSTTKGGSTDAAATDPLRWTYSQGTSV